LSPIRTCIGCGQPDTKRVLTRLATRDGAVVADLAGRLPGRGAYLHRRPECLDRFVKSRVKVFRSLGRGIDRAQRQAIVEVMRERLES
jgi:predicted RNA-binding protein YlxR (DUF448 family)